MLSNSARLSNLVSIFQDILFQNNDLLTAFITAGTTMTAWRKGSIIYHLKLKMKLFVAFMLCKARRVDVVKQIGLARHRLILGNSFLGESNLYFRYYISLNPEGRIPLVTLVLLLIIFGNLCHFHSSLSCIFFLIGDFNSSLFSLSVLFIGLLSLSSISCRFTVEIKPLPTLHSTIPLPFLRLWVQFWIKTDRT